MFGKKNWQSATATIVVVNIKRISGDGLTPTRDKAQADAFAAALKQNPRQ
jgi:hypothetical protein